MAEAAMIGLGLAGTALDVVGQIKQAEAAAEDYEFQAKEADRIAGKLNISAYRTEDQYREETRRSAQEGRMAVGSIRAAYGASGVTMDGTPQEYLEQNAAIAQANTIAIKMKGILEAKALRDDAETTRRQGVQYRLAADRARSTGILTAVTAGVKGLSSMGQASYARSSG